MKIVSEIGGFTLKEADDVRRALGKKKLEVLEPYQKQFASGALKTTTMTKTEVDELWSSLLAFADYGFNKSHSVAYSLITYICAYLKANYPKEFFCALMTVRSKVMQPKLWAQKAPQFVNDARQMGIKIHGPSIQKSGIGFTIHEDEIYFGLNAIKGVGVSAAKSAMRARGNKRFEDIWDFLSRISMSQINTKHFGAMVHAGAFDMMGYLREELVEKLKDIYKYYRDTTNYKQRLIDSAQRSEENEVKKKAKEDIDRRLKEAKALARTYKKNKEPVPDHILHVIDREKRLREYRATAAQVKETGGDILNALTTEQLTEYEESIWLRKKPELKILDVPEKPELQRVRSFSLSVQQLMMQADMIGCYLGTHPARILFPQAKPLAEIEDTVFAEVAGVVMQVKEIITRKGDPMCFVQFGDGTALGEGVVFPQVFAKLTARKTIPQEGDVIRIRGRVDMVDPMVKILVNDIEIHRRSE